MTKYYSQAGQDLFVLHTTNNLKNGLFVDIAAAHPININNTYILETDYNWDGISVELNPSWNELWKDRKCKFINSDAFLLDYKFLFDELLQKHEKKEKHLNYLSLDLEPPELTNKLLHFLPLDEYIFDVITYEHDFYREGDKYKKDAKEYLTSLGYILKVEDVSGGSLDYIFEDWYVRK